MTEPLYQSKIGVKKMNSSIFRNDSVIAIMMLAVSEASVKTPLGIQDHLKKRFNSKLGIEEVTQKLRKLACLDYCAVTVGENTWRVTDLGIDVLRENGVSMCCGLLQRNR